MKPAPPLLTSIRACSAEGGEGCRAAAGGRRDGWRLIYRLIFFICIRSALAYKMRHTEQWQRGVNLLLGPERFCGPRYVQLRIAGQRVARHGGRLPCGGQGDGPAARPERQAAQAAQALAARPRRVRSVPPHAPLPCPLPRLRMAPSRPRLLAPALSRSPCRCCLHTACPRRLLFGGGSRPASAVRAAAACLSSAGAAAVAAVHVGSTHGMTIRSPAQRP